MDQTVRVRFAPSPTGVLHIGGVRTALYNYLFARHNEGSFILRIEDTDRSRFVPEAEDYIMESLRWLGIVPNEGPSVGGDYGPYRQSERKSLYMRYAQELVDQGQAYYAFDTPEQLTAMRERLQAAGSHILHYGSATRMEMSNSLSLTKEEVALRLDKEVPYVIRLKVDPGQTISFYDVVRDEVSFNTDEVDDKVLLKTDGMPTYHLANIIDDHMMGISHVIRGEEWLPSTPFHILLYRAFEWTPPTFCHLPLILKPNGKGKLSKRDGAKLGIPVFPLTWEGNGPEDTVIGFREVGFLPEGVINFLAFLGWNPGTEQEIFTIEELIQAFTLDDVKKAGAQFNFEKAKWFNQQHILRKPIPDLAQAVRPYLSSDISSITDSRLEEALQFMQERMTLLSDLEGEAPYLFRPVQDYDQKMIRKRWKGNAREYLTYLTVLAEGLPSFSATSFEAATQSYMEAESIGAGQIYPIMRLALAGNTKGPGIFDVAGYIGQEETVRRLKLAPAVFDEVVESHVM